MDANANITYLREEAGALLGTLLSVQPREPAAATGGARSRAARGRGWRGPA